MAGNLPKPLFMWSLPHEPDYVGALEEQLADYRIIPLRQAALEMSEKLFDKRKIIAVSDLLPPGETRELEQASAHYENALRRALAKEKEPWVRALCYDATRSVLYASFRIWRLLERLKSRVDLMSAVIMPPFSRIHRTFNESIEIRLLEQTLAAIHYEAYHPAAHWKTPWSTQGKALVGRMLNQAAPWFLSWPTRCTLPEQTCDVLFAGFLGTDLLTQHELVSRVMDTNAAKVRWLYREQPRLALSSDEKDTGALRQAEIVPEPSQCVWRRPWMEAFSRAAIAERLIDVLRGLPLPVTAPPRGIPLLASTIVHHQLPLRASYHAVKYSLARAKPRVLVASCNVGIMALVREWARENRVIYVKLPHGFEYEDAIDYDWDNDVTGVMGTWLRDKVLQRPSVCGEVYLAGGVHLAAQARRPAIAVSANRMIPGRVIFLASEFLRTGFPDTLDQMRDDLVGLIQSLNAVGFHLMIRCHPRSRFKWFYREVIASQCERDEHLNVFSDGLTSLNEELDQAAVAVMRISSSSAIVAMYARVPLVGWVPRPGHSGSDDFLSGLPIWAKEGPELARLAKRVATDSIYRSSIISQQDNYLSQIVEDPHGDPWRRSIEVIKKVLERSGERERA